MKREYRARRERRRNYKKLVAGMVVLTFLSFSVFGLGVYNLLDSFTPFASDQFSGWLRFSTGEDMTVLFLGTDEEEEARGRSDTLIVATIDFDRETVGMLSIPRDTRVEIPGYGGLRKINDAHVLGGGPLALLTVEELLDLPIDAYVATDFSGFQEIVDLLGGVTMEVQSHKQYTDHAGDLYIDIPPGVHRFDGEQALHYVRYRADGLGDIGRIARQQQFIRATAKEALQMKTLPQLPQLIEHLGEHVKTDLSVKEMLRLGKLLAGVNNIVLETKTLPGEARDVEGVNFWIHDPRETRLVVDDLLRSGEYFENREVNLKIYNGNGIPGMAREVAGELQRRGYQVLDVTNAEHFQHRKTSIRVLNRSHRSAAQRLAQVFGVRLENAYNRQEDWDIEIILGSDLVDG